MKNQFVGDINNYFKYGLLRILSGFGKKKIGVCWMLTPERTEYLDHPREWGNFDRKVFDKLRRIVRARSIRRIENAEILPGAQFQNEPFKDGSRGTYFDEGLSKFAGVDLVFFDPDVGLAMSPLKAGNKRLHFSELGKAFKNGHSVFVIQFPLFKKGWLKQHVKLIHRATRAPKIYTFRTPSVAFFLAAQRRHVNFFRRQAKEVKKCWGRVITVTSDLDRE